MTLSEQQQEQERLYSFPYHHLVTYNDEISISKTWGWSIEYLGRVELVINTLDKINFDNYLDVGCGDGKLISILSQKYVDKAFTGIDYSDRAIALAKYFSNSGNTEFKCFDIFNDRMDTEYGVISLIEVIEHIEPGRLNNFLKNGIELLKSGGYFIGSVPSQQLPLRAKHYQHFTREKLKNLLSNHIEVKDIFYIDNKNILARKLKFLSLLINSKKIQNFAFDYYKNNCLYSNDKGEGIFFICQKN